SSPATCALGTTPWRARSTWSPGTTSSAWWTRPAPTRRTLVHQGEAESLPTDEKKETRSETNSLAGPRRGPDAGARCVRWRRGDRHHRRGRHDGTDGDDTGHDRADRDD